MVVVDQLQRGVAYPKRLVEVELDEGVRPGCQSGERESWKDGKSMKQKWEGSV